jgi:hypothetical protein
MFSMSFLKKRIIPIIVVTGAILATAHAQYQLYLWANFEDGRFQQGAVPLGDYPNTVKVVDFSKIPNMPQDFHAGLAGREVGKHGLCLKGDPGIWITGLADGVLLDRDKLGASGKALYQADFFIPPDGNYIPSLAVLAMEPLPQGITQPQSFYRFGITKVSNNHHIYFSHVILNESTARVFLWDREFTKKIPRPGWHRFAIVFDGPSKIHCYIDGHEPGFSPTEEPSLRKLQVGILLAEKNEARYDAFVDNLSIQWTPEDVPIPDSPYAHSWGGAAAPQMTIGSALENTALLSSTSLEWLDAKAAWERSQSSGAPILAYFQAPKIPMTRRLDEIFDANKEARDFLGKCVLLKIDVNQYQGGFLAQKFNIFKVPTIILMDAQSREIGRAIFGRDDNWASLLAKLQSK